MGEEI